MSEPKTDYKVIIKPLSKATSSTNFSYETGRSKYSYGTVDLNDYLSKEEAGDLVTQEALDAVKEELEKEIQESAGGGVTIEQGAENTHVTVSYAEGVYTINETDIASADALTAESSRALEREQALLNDIDTLSAAVEEIESAEEISSEAVDELWREIIG